VVGNHDERNPQVLKLPWERKGDLVTFRDNGRRAILCHYPLETWKGAHSGSLHFHGHSHGSLRRRIPMRFDVGVDVLGRPFEWSELLEPSASMRYEPQDHHGAGLTRCASCLKVRPVTLRTWVDPVGPEANPSDPNAPARVTAAICEDCAIIHWAWAPAREAQP
jgi:hypothetical protein